MKIAFVAHHVHRYGSEPQYVSALAMAIPINHQVTIFSSSAERSIDTGIRHREVWTLPGGAVVRAASFSVASSLLMFLSRLKKVGGFDIIHVHSIDWRLADVVTSHYCASEAARQLARSAPPVKLGQRVEI